MSVKCGIDVVEIERIKHSIDRNNDAFLNRVFTEKEIDYCKSKGKMQYESFAARFAAKEAFSKALGYGITNGISFKEIEICRTEKGKPYIELLGKTKLVYEDMKVSSMDVSLSHSKTIATAVVVIEL